MNCDVCDEEIIERPMNSNVTGGDWVASCPICGWCSEDEVEWRINFNPTKKQIISQKKLVNDIWDDLHYLIYMDNKGHRHDLEIASVFQKVMELSNSMIIEKPYESAIETVINYEGEE